MNKKVPIGRSSLLLLVLLTGLVIVAPHNARAGNGNTINKSSDSVNQPGEELPFFHYPIAWLGQALLVRNSGHGSDSYIPVSCAPGYSVKNLNAVSAKWTSVPDCHFALFYLSLILFPFHSFW